MTRSAVIKSHSLDQLSDEQLRCRRFGHDFYPYHSIDIVVRRGEVVTYTELLHCQHGCGVRGKESYETFRGRRHRIGKRPLDYSGAPGYLLSVDVSLDDIRDEWFRRFPPRMNGKRQ